MRARSLIRVTLLTLAPALIATSAYAAPRPANDLAAMVNRPMRNCGTAEPVAGDLEAVRQAARRWATPSRQVALNGTIPVAIHVITSGGEGDVTDSQIAEQIRALNHGYAGTGLRFTLSSVDRTENKNWFRMAPGTGVEKQAKQALSIDPAHHMNLYTCAPGKGLLGWAYFPWSVPEDHYIHGIVVHYASLPGGAFVPYDLGGTAVHEAGHYLGLLHTFQGGCVAPGDLVDDTPFEASPAFGCPEGRNTCPQPGDDPIHNYMDYTDDACYTEFTAGQVARITEIVPIYRPSLLGGPLALAGRKGDAGDLASGRGEANGRLTLDSSPNPFTRFTTLAFSLPRADRVTLEVFDLAGHRVQRLIDAELPAGHHTASLGAERLAPGMYFVSLRVGAERVRRSVILTR